MCNYAAEASPVPCISYLRSEEPAPSKRKVSTEFSNQSEHSKRHTALIYQLKANIERILAPCSMLNDPTNTKYVRAKKYVCPLESCSKAYTRPSLLQQHRRTHTNERPFACLEPGCDKRFFRNSHLQVHKHTHAKEKPLKCSVCHKGFITNQQLLRHTKTHKPEYLCPYDCGSRFTDGEAMTNHVLENHMNSDVLFSYPSEELSESLTDRTSDTISPSMVGSERISEDCFSNLYCKQPECVGHEAYESISHLIEHYDTYHSFVPPCLFQ